MSMTGQEFLQTTAKHDNAPQIWSWDIAAVYDVQNTAHKLFGVLGTIDALFSLPAYIILSAKCT